MGKKLGMFFLTAVLAAALSGCAGVKGEGSGISGDT